MKNLHLHIQRELGERVILLWEWEHLVRKIMDFSNHRRFMLRCLGAGITPISVRLKNTIRMSRSFDIIRKVDRQLLNERVRSINNTIELSSW